MATSVAFAGAPASSTRWGVALPVRPQLARQRRLPRPLQVGALSSRRCCHPRHHHDYHPPLLPLSVADGTRRLGLHVTAGVGPRGAAGGSDGEGVAGRADGSGGSSGSSGDGRDSDSVGGGRGVRRISTEAEAPQVIAADVSAPADSMAGGNAGGVQVPSPIPPPPPSFDLSLAHRGIGTFADLSDATSPAHLYVGGIVVPRHRWSRRHRAAGVYRSVEYRVMGLDAVDASTGARTPYASTAEAAAAGVPPADLVASLVPAQRLLPRFDRPGGWPVEVGVTDARLLSFKADIACSLAVTLALAASFLGIGIGGPSIASVYVVNSASMEPTVAVGDALVVEKVSLRGVGRGERGAVGAAVAAPAASSATPAAAALSSSVDGDTAEQVARPLPPGPRVGEVVLFHPPAALRQRAAADGTVLHAKDAFVKRVVAVSGDTVEVRGGVVSVNGVRVGGLPAGGEGAADLRDGAPMPGMAAVPATQSTNETRPAPALAAAAAAAADPPSAGRLRRGGSSGGGGGGGGALPPDVRLVVGDGQLFVLGDNAPHSCDSRYWGLLPVTDVVGRPVGRVWPPSRAALTRLDGPPAAAGTAVASSVRVATADAADSMATSVAALGGGAAPSSLAIASAPPPTPLSLAAAAALADSRPSGGRRRAARRAVVAAIRAALAAAPDRTLTATSAAAQLTAAAAVTASGRRQPPLLANPDVALTWAPPERVALTGAAGIGLATPVVDVVVVVPRRVLRGKDVKRGQWADKRRLYLCAVADALAATDAGATPFTDPGAAVAGRRSGRGAKRKAADSGDATTTLGAAPASAGWTDISWSAGVGGDPSRPTLTATHGATGTRVRLLAAAPTNVFDLRRLADRFANAGGPVPSPVYNAGVAADVAATAAARHLRTVLGASGRRAAVLLRAGGSDASIAGDLQHFRSVLAFVRRGGLRNRSVGEGQPPAWLAIPPVHRQEARGGPHEAADQGGDASDRDGDSGGDGSDGSDGDARDSAPDGVHLLPAALPPVNVLARLPATELAALEADARSTLAALAHSGATAGAGPGSHAALFSPAPPPPPPARYDALVRVALPVDADDDDTTAAAAAGVVTTALVGSRRASAAVVLVPPAPGVLLMGIVASPATLFRRVDTAASGSPSAVTPTGSARPAPSAEATAAFRAFWGDASELRRFADGTIAESVVWPASATPDVADVPAALLSAALSRHVPGAEVAAVMTGARWGSLPPEATLSAPAAAAAADALGVAARATDPAVVGGKVVGLAPMSPLLRRTEPVAGAGGLTASRGSRVVRAPLELVVRIRVAGAVADGAQDEDSTLAAAVMMKLCLGLAAGLRAGGVDATAVAGGSVEAAVGGWVYRLTPAALSSDDDTPITGAAGEGEWLTVTRPALAEALRQVAAAMPGFSAAARLAKRWLSSQMLATAYADELVECLVAAALAPVGRGLPAVGGSALSGFCRFLYLLTDHPFAAAPVVVDLPGLEDVRLPSVEGGGVGGGGVVGAAGSELGAAADADADRTACLYAAAAAAYAERGRVPGGGGGGGGHASGGGVIPLTLATALDVGGGTFAPATRRGPPPVVLRRTIAAAAAALAVITAAGGALDDRRLFTPPLADYDAVINLDPASVPAVEVAADAAAAAAGVRALKGGELTGMVGGGKRRVRRRLSHALVGYDPVAAYVAALERGWGRCAAFFMDPLGGTAVGVVWRGDGASAFGVNRTVYSLPVGVVPPGGGGGTTSIKKKAKKRHRADVAPGSEAGGIARLVWNKDEMLWAMVSLGGELVAGVRRRGVDW
ncbi:hypothetical protein MMPV_003665 [Pyropia vietnamensis]